MSPALLLLASLASAASPPVVIRARGVEFTTADVVEAAVRVRAEGKSFTAEQLIEGLATEAALAAEALRLKLDAEPEGKALLAFGRQKHVARLYAERLARVTTPTEAEARAAFHLRADTARFQSIAVATREEAAALRGRLEAGADFAREAVRSLDPSATSNKGDSGLVTRITLDEQLAKAIFESRKGTLIGPMQLGKGWIVARVLEVSVRTEAEFAAARPQVEALLTSKKTSDAVQHAAAMLRARASIWIDEPFLKSLDPRADFGAKALDHVTLKVDGQPFRLRDVAPALRGVNRGGHGGKALMISAVTGFATDLLLAAEVRKQGFGGEPEVAAAMRRTDLHLLAEYLGRRLYVEATSKGSPKQQAEAFKRRLDEIRKRNDLWLDRAAAVAALGPVK